MSHTSTQSVHSVHKDLLEDKGCPSIRMCINSQTPPYLCKQAHTCNSTSLLGSSAPSCHSALAPVRVQLPLSLSNSLPCDSVMPNASLTPSAAQADFTEARWTSSRPCISASCKKSASCLCCCCKPETMLESPKVYLHIKQMLYITQHFEPRDCRLTCDILTC